MFNKAKQKKVEVKSETPEAVEIKVNIKPLVQIHEVVTLVDGEKAERVFKIEIESRDVITVSPRQYDGIFMEMLRHKDAGELIHDISEVHAEKHVAAHRSAIDLGRTLHRIMEEAHNQAEGLING